MNEELNIFKGKKIFLTGHTGFKGSWLLTWLHKLGANVKGYALSPQKEQCLYNSMQGDALCESVIADIRDEQRLQKELSDFQPDFVFHLAAQPLVRLSYKEPLETYQTNVIGTGNLIHALQSVNKKCTALLVTTDKVYENLEWDYPYRENDRLGGYDPYSSSKACCEILISSFRQSFFNINNYDNHQKAIIAARAGNVIGGGDWSDDRIIPDIVRALQQDKPIQVRNPMAVRPWQHVLEPVYGYLMLAAKAHNNPQKYTGAWNFGPHLEDCLTVETLVNKAIQVWGSGQYESPKLKGQPHEAGLLKLDVSKAYSQLGWKPKWNSAKAIEATIEWYKQASKGQKEAQEFTYQQIKQYDI